MTLLGNIKRQRTQVFQRARVHLRSRAHCPREIVGVAWHKTAEVHEQRRDVSPQGHHQL